MSIYLGKQEVSSYIHTSGDPEIVVEKPKLQDITTDGRTSIIKPGEGYNGLSRVFIDNDHLLLNERNYKILTGRDKAEIFYDLDTRWFNDWLFFNRSYLTKIYSRTVQSVGQYGINNLLDLEEIDLQNCTLLSYHALGTQGSTCALKYVNLPKLNNISEYAFQHAFSSGVTPVPGKAGVLYTGHINYVYDSAFTSCYSLSEMVVGDANTNDFTKDYRDSLSVYYQPSYESFTTFPELLFKDCNKLKALILPEVHGIYNIAGDLFETTPTDFRIYVDDSKLDEYKSAWTQYADRFRTLNEHPFYNYTFDYYKIRDCYKVKTYGEYENATEANALRVLTPRSYKGKLPILDVDLFANCTFDKLVIGSGTFGLYNCFKNTKINTLEFENFSRIHEIKEMTFPFAQIENVILNCSLTEYFDHLENDDIGYFYTDDTETVFSSVGIYDAPWNANHIYTYPGFEITDMFIPAEPFKERGMLGWGYLAGAHFNNIYLNRNITKIWNYACEGAHDTKIYIPNSVTTVKQHAFYGMYNVELFIEAEEKPAGWEYGWDKDFTTSNITVHWGSQM